MISRNISGTLFLLHCQSWYLILNINVLSFVSSLFLFSSSPLLQSLVIVLISTHSPRLLSVYHFLHPGVYVLKQIVVFAFSLGNTVTSVFSFVLLLLLSSVCCHLWSNHRNKADIKKMVFSEDHGKQDLASGGGIIEQLVRSQEILFLCSPRSHSKHRWKYTF